jgi:hypothetical protein
MHIETRVILPSLAKAGSVTVLASMHCAQLGVVQELLDQHTGCCSYFTGNKEK